MDIRFSERALGIEEGIFSVLNTKKEELIKAGRTVYNFSVGTPDFKTPDHIMKAMQEACKDPENYKYALADRPGDAGSYARFLPDTFWSGTHDRPDHEYVWFAGRHGAHRPGTL